VAYRRDLDAFVEWTQRLGLTGPQDVDRKVLRRYLAHLGTREYAKRTIARKASSLRRYFGWLHRTHVLALDPSRGLAAPSGAGRLPHVLKEDELVALLDDPPARVTDDDPVVRRRDDGAPSCSTAAAAHQRAVRAPARRPRPAGPPCGCGARAASSGRCR
jgi:site-specific recombinase XerD